MKLRDPWLTRAIPESFGDEFPMIKCNTNLRRLLYFTMHNSRAGFDAKRSNIKVTRSTDRFLSLSLSLCVCVCVYVCVFAIGATSLYYRSSLPSPLSHRFSLVPFSVPPLPSLILTSLSSLPVVVLPSLPVHRTHQIPLSCSNSAINPAQYGLTRHGQC